MKRVVLDLIALAVLYIVLFLGAYLYRSYQHFGWLNVPGPNHTTIAVPAWTK